MRIRSRAARSAITLLLTLAMVISCAAVSFGNSHIKKMTTYSEVIKSGNYAYCCDLYSIYRVDLKTNKVKRLVKPSGSGFGDMRLHKGYLYYQWYSQGTYSGLSRMKTNGKSDKNLTGGDNIYSYAIAGSRIYYTNFLQDDYGDYEEHKEMKLNGKGKKHSAYAIRTTEKKANKKGYRVITKESKNFDYWDGTGYVISYLKKPDGKKIRLAKTYGKNIPI